MRRKTTVSLAVKCSMGSSTNLSSVCGPIGMLVFLLRGHLQYDCQTRNSRPYCGPQLIRRHIQRQRGVYMETCSSLPKRGIYFADKQKGRRRGECLSQRAAVPPRSGCEFFCDDYDHVWLIIPDTKG